MAVPAPGPEATPEAEADPAVLASYSSAPYAHLGLGLGLYGLHYPLYYHHPYYVGRKRYDKLLKQTQFLKHFEKWKCSI